jgi:ribosome-associated protein
MSWSKELVESEVYYRTSRSSGPGGQNVNKTETRVEVIFSLSKSCAFDEDQSGKLYGKLANRINGSGELIIASSEARSQLRNKQIALKKLLDLIENGLWVEKPRKKSRRSKASIRRRLEGKTKRSQTKSQRRWRLGRD